MSEADQFKLAATILHAHKYSAYHSHIVYLLKLSIYIKLPYNLLHALGYLGFYT